MKHDGVPTIPRLVQASVVAIASFFASACGSGTAPQGATPATTPTPAPTPVAAATPRAFVCPLPARPDQGIQCPKIDSKLGGYVSTAVDTVIRTQPELFNLGDTRGDSVKVLDRHKYQTAVVAAINAQGGVCAHDDNEEIGLKINNDFNEQFNVWTSAGYTRRSYITTCFPAQF
jgi:hypothetical protein